MHARGRARMGPGPSGRSRPRRAGCPPRSARRADLRPDSPSGRPRRHNACAAPAPHNARYGHSAPGTIPLMPPSSRPAVRSPRPGRQSARAAAPSVVPYGPPSPGRQTAHPAVSASRMVTESGAPARPSRHPLMPPRTAVALAITPRTPPASFAGFVRRLRRPERPTGGPWAAPAVREPSTGPPASPAPAIQAPPSPPVAVSPADLTPTTPLASMPHGRICSRPP